MCPVWTSLSVCGNHVVLDMRWKNRHSKLPIFCILSCVWRLNIWGANELFFFPFKERCSFLVITSVINGDVENAWQSSLKENQERNILVPWLIFLKMLLPDPMIQNRKGSHNSRSVNQKAPKPTDNHNKQVVFLRRTAFYKIFLMTGIHYWCNSINGSALTPELQPKQYTKTDCLLACGKNHETSPWNIS